MINLYKFINKHDQGYKNAYVFGGKILFSNGIRMLAMDYSEENGVYHINENGVISRASEEYQNAFKGMMNRFKEVYEIKSKATNYKYMVDAEIPKLFKHINMKNRRPMALLDNGVWASGTMEGHVGWYNPVFLKEFAGMKGIIRYNYNGSEMLFSSGEYELILTPCRR